MCGHPIFFSAFYIMVFVDHQESVFAAPPPQAGATLVEYFAKACPHCVHLKPVWEAAKSHGIDGVDFVAKECYTDNWAPGKDLADCKAHGVDAFPTLKFFRAGDNTGEDIPPLMGNTNKERTNELLEYVESIANGNIKQQAIGLGSLSVSLLCPRKQTLTLSNFL